jgi:hypothetical protein
VISCPNDYQVKILTSDDEWISIFVPTTNG